MFYIRTVVLWCGGAGGQEADQRLAHCTINVINPFLTLTRTRGATDKCTVGAIHQFSGTSGCIQLDQASVNPPDLCLKWGVFLLDIFIVYPHLHSRLSMSSETETYPAYVTNQTTSLACRAHLLFWLCITFMKYIDWPKPSPSVETLVASTWPSVAQCAMDRDIDGIGVINLATVGGAAGHRTLDAGRCRVKRPIGIASIQRSDCVASRGYLSPCLV